MSWVNFFEERIGVKDGGNAPLYRLGGYAVSNCKVELNYNNPMSVGKG